MTQDRDRVGIAVYREYMVECTRCGMVDGQKTRERAERMAREHADSHREDDDRTRMFSDFHAAMTWANA